MINPTREQVAVALFSILETLTASFNTISRRVALWDNTTNFPALYMGQPMEDEARPNATATPQQTTIEFDIFVYINSLDPTVVPDTALNNAIDAIENAIAPTASTGWVQTLGGIVDHAWIEGAIHRAPGYLDGKGFALFTIKVLVPN